MTYMMNSKGPGAGSILTADGGSDVGVGGLEPQRRRRSG